MSKSVRSVWLAAVVFSAFVVTPHQSQARPKIVLIMADDV